MLRVTDRLMENLIKEVIERDNKTDINRKRGEEKEVRLKKLVKAINDIVEHEIFSVPLCCSFVIKKVSVLIMLHSKCTSVICFDSL